MISTSDVPLSTYADNILLFSGSGSLVDTHPNKIAINGDPKKLIDMVQRARPLAPAAVPPEALVTTGRMHLPTRLRRQDNITQTSGKCNSGDNSTNPDCYQLNPWGNGRWVDPRVAMHYAKNELLCRWVNPVAKLSLQVEKTDEKGLLAPGTLMPLEEDPKTHKTVPLALDPQCSYMQPFMWTTFDGTDIEQYVHWDSIEERWTPTFETSEDMMRAIHVTGIQLDGEESAEYETIVNDNSDFTEIPHKVYQITYTTLANIMARRTLVKEDGTFGLGERPIPQLGARLEWFIPEFDNMSDKAGNRQLEAWYQVPSGDTWKKVEKNGTGAPVDLFAKNEYDDAYGHPSNWRWRFTKNWLARWNIAKHDTYRGEPHHELLIRPVETNYANAVMSRGMKRIEQIVKWMLNVSTTAMGAPMLKIFTDVQKAEREKLGRLFSEREYELLKAIITAANTAGGATDATVRETTVGALYRLLIKVRADIDMEIQERSRRIFGTVSRLTDNVADECVVFMDFLKH